MLPILLAAITFHTNFEGGNLGKAEQVAPGHFRVPILGDTDQDGRNRQASWYYFRVDSAAGQPLTIDLIDLPGEYNYCPNRGAISGVTPPFWSTDQKQWTAFENVEYDDAEPRLRLKITPSTNRIWIAHVPPYTNVNLQQLLQELNLKPMSIGKTPDGRDIPLLIITDPSIPDAKKKTIWLMFRQHAWEAGSSWAGEGAIRFLTSKEAASIRREAAFHILPMCDPDGVAKGKVRFNTLGFDLNRNWDNFDEKRMPEIAAQHRAIMKSPRIDLFISLHNTETAEYLDGPPDREGAIRPLMNRLFEGLSASKYFQASRPPSIPAVSTTEGKPGRMTVNQGLYRDRKIPAFLIEQRIAKHPKLGRQPTIEDRLGFGRDLVLAAIKAVTP